MASDIIMPALGMAQDSGLLVAWRKSPGDPVKVGEPLFEVETDKATMEVEATAEGYLSAVTAGNGEDVPVGQVIARIVATEAEVDRTPPKGKAAPQAAAPQPKAPETPPVAKHAAPVVAGAAPAAAPKAAPKIAPPKPAHPTGRILASPKVKAIAAAEGLDLSRLAKAGHPQPYHVADLDHLRRAASSTRSSLSARVDGSALMALMKKATNADSARVLASFAKGAWEQVLGEAPAIALQRADGTVEGDGALTLVDLTGTRLTAYAPPEGLVLSVGSDAASITLTLSFDEATLPFASAAAFLNETAARVEDPLRQLV